MVDPLSVAASVVGLVVPALHGIRVLKTDLDKIVGAPDAIARLKADVSFMDGSLALLKDIDEPTWASLGSGVLKHATSALSDCVPTCDAIRNDIVRWTKRSAGGKLTWRDRVKVGFFKDQQLKAYESQLQALKLTFNSTVGTVTLYSSLRNTQLTQELRNAFVKERGSLEAASLTIHSDIEETQQALARIQLEPETQQQQDLDEDDDEDPREIVTETLKRLQEMLQTSHALLTELAAKAQDSEIAQAANNGAGNMTVTFGTNHQGVQMGVNNGGFTWHGK